MYSLFHFCGGHDDNPGDYDLMVLILAINSSPTVLTFCYVTWMYLSTVLFPVSVVLCI